MRQKGTSRSERGDGCLEFVVARIEQALFSLGQAEINLRNLRISRLPQVAESLSAAAADIESLRSALPHQAASAYCIEQRTIFRPA